MLPRLLRKRYHKGPRRMPLLKDELLFIILGHLLLGLIIGYGLS